MKFQPTVWAPRSHRTCCGLRTRHRPIVPRLPTWPRVLALLSIVALFVAAVVAYEWRARQETLLARERELEKFEERTLMFFAQHGAVQVIAKDFFSNGRGTQCCFTLQTPYERCILHRSMHPIHGLGLVSNIFPGDYVHVGYAYDPYLSPLRNQEKVAQLYPTKKP